MKTCPKCKTTKSIDNFTKNKNSKDKLQRICKECYKGYRNKEYNQNYYKLNKQKHHENGKNWAIKNKEKKNLIAIKSNLKNKFNMTLEDYILIFEKQDYKCALCEYFWEKEILYNRNRKNRPCVDHCHKTGKVRGILCDKCNKGLGLFYDNIKVLKNAIKYLEKL